MVFCNIMLYNKIAVQKIGMAVDLSAQVSGPINEIQGVKMGRFRNQINSIILENGGKV